MAYLEALAGWRLTDGLLGWFAETTLVASALAALAALVARVPRLAPGPAARHALWLLVLIKLVTPPLVHWPWSVPLPIAASRPASRPLADHPARVVHKITAGSGSARALAAVAGAGTPARDEIRTKLVASTWALPFDLKTILPSRDLSAWLALAWLGGSVVLAINQGRRIGRFRRLLSEATPAPRWLADEAATIGDRLAVRVPPILVVPGLGTPVLWCLGRPVLLVPAQLLKTLEADRWRSIVAHELAHLRRGDHWVRRLELAAGLAWWWNPLYWLARGRLDFEAELACDAWAVWALPADRLSYAESLIRICTNLSPTGSPRPALGIAGTGRSFERRLTMILRDRVNHRVSAPGLLAASLLAALALPSWTRAESPRVEDTAPVVASVPVVLAEVVLNDDDDDDKDQEKSAKLKAERDKLQQQMNNLDKEMAGKFGPGSEFEKKMEALGREMEAKFGPGSEFEKKMEGLGREMEAKFGPGSEFAKQIEGNFGPGSDFAKKIAEAMKDGDPGDDKSEPKRAKLKADLDKANADKEKDRADASKTRAEASKVRAEATKAKAEKSKAEAKAKVQAKAKAKPAPDKRARRIEILESKIDELMSELKKLKAEPAADVEVDDQG